MPPVHPIPFPLYTGEETDVSADVPGKYPVGLAGRGYNLDLKSNQFSWQSIPILKPQQNSNNQVDEASLNPEGLWRRSQTSWHEGAGQTYLDKPESSSARFRSSLLIDPWTKGEISLLPETDLLFGVDSNFFIGENLQFITAGDFVYLAIDAFLYLIGDPLGVAPTSTLTNIQLGETPRDIASMASDGNYVYTALGLNGVHRIARGTLVGEHYSDLEASLVGYTLGRLMAARQSSIYNITAPGVAPTALLTHPNPDFTWVGFAEGKGHIFAAGFSGDKSIIYKTAIRPDGTALAAPSAAGQLPDGEIVRSIYGYLGFILIGTDNGIRFSVPDTNGNLEIGALIETNSPVYCFEGQGSFVWFGWSNYNSIITGLGRIDLKTIVDGVAPAYATDLMVPTQGAVKSVITYQGRRLFTVAQAAGGGFVESLNRSSGGIIDSGLISYGIPEDKVALFVDVRYRDLQGADQVAIARQDGVFTTLGTNTETLAVKQFEANSLRSELLEIRHTLYRDATNFLLGPVITRHTLKSQVTVNMGSHWIVPLMISEREQTNQTETARDVLEEFMFLAGLASEKATVTFQYLATSYTVTVEDAQFHPTHLDDNHPHDGFNGTMIVKLKVVV